MKLIIEVETNSKNDLVEALELLNHKLNVKMGKEPELTVEPKTEVAVKQTETVVEDTKPTKPIPKPTQKKKVAPEQTITLSDLKDSAKNAVARSSREDVKKVISNYAPKLAEVSEEDFGKLYKALQELGK